MIQAAMTPNYETLKSAFVNGMEFKRMPFETYLDKHPIKKETDNEVLANVAKGMYNPKDILQITKTKTMISGTDWNAVTEMVSSNKSLSDALRKGKNILEDAFNQGSKNPAICFMAWYDALAEYVLSAANSLVGQKAPVSVIYDELTTLSEDLSKNPDFKEAKRNVYQGLKKMYPKTYKKRLKLMEQGYNKKVQNGVTEIVRKIVIK